MKFSQKNQKFSLKAGSVYRAYQGIGGFWLLCHFRAVNEWVLIGLHDGNRWATTAETPEGAFNGQEYYFNEVTPIELTYTLP